MASLLRLFSSDNGVNFTALTPPFIRVVPSHGAAGAWEHGSALVTDVVHSPARHHQPCCRFVMVGELELEFSISKHLLQVKFSILKHTICLAFQSKTNSATYFLAKAQLNVLDRGGDLCCAWVELGGFYHPLNTY